MVVDGDSSVRRFLQAFLAARGYQVITLGGEEALKQHSSESGQRQSF